MAQVWIGTTCQWITDMKHHCAWEILIFIFFFNLRFSYSKQNHNTNTSPNKPWHCWAAAVLCCQSTIKIEKSFCIQTISSCAHGAHSRWQCKNYISLGPEILLKYEGGNKGVIMIIQENPIGFQCQALNLQWKLSPCKVWFFQCMLQSRVNLF